MTSAGEHTVTLTTTYGQNAPTGFVTVTLTYNGATYTKVISVSSVEQGKYLGLATAISGATATIDANSTPVKAGTVSSGSNTATLGDYVVWKSATTSSYTKTCCYSYVCTANGEYSWVQDKSDTANMNALSDITSIITSTDENTIALLLVQRLAANTAFIGTLFAQYISVSGGIAVGGRYNANGTLRDRTKDGVYLGSDGIMGRISSSTNFLAGTDAGQNGGTDVVYIGSMAGYASSGDGNIAIGNYALSGVGSSTPSTSYACNNNIAIGNQSMRQYSVAATENIAIGSSTMRVIRNACTANVAIGFLAGYSMNGGSENVLIGTSVGATSTSTTKFAAGANYNVGIGSSVLSSITSGSNNIAIGATTGNYISSGSLNILIGTLSGNAITTGNYNVALSYMAGNKITTGSHNITIGYMAGDNITTGSCNVVIGYDIDAPSATASNQVVIGTMGQRIVLSSSGFLYYKSASVSQQVARASLSNGILTIYIGA